ncbi:hypothetical protein GcC1_210041 [Golovinomyces cichoracearum]|uniref:Ribonucleases P/MRP subunit Pop8-like domain-containing protein n=1 Tax=Golovinomyces cichoracearum TaxID=62708 RepID=A0A420HAX5_9PEZI|nr:hypothetical protein GcC1_210041 [Golovinomyces cichoracearum]
MSDDALSKKNSSGHEIKSKTISNPLWAYICLQVYTETSVIHNLDPLSVHSYLVSAFTQLFGLTGAAVSFDILKVEKNLCWIRVTSSEVSAVLAAVSSWHGISSEQGRLGWRVKAKGNWLSCLIPQQELGIWND